MRVLTCGNLFPPAAMGGYERTWVDGLRALAGAGHAARVLTTDLPADGPAPFDDVHRDLRWYWRDHRFVDPPVRERFAIERANAATLRRHLEEFRPDVVCWWAMGGMSLSLIEQVRRAGLPAVGVVGDGWMLYGPQRDAWTRMWARHPRLATVAERASGVPTRLDLGDAAHWLFNSEATRERSEQAVPDLLRGDVLRVGVDPAAFPPAAAPDWDWRLAYVGRVEPRKGVATAIAALAEIPGARLRVTGHSEDGYRAELDRQAHALGLEQRVRFDEAGADEVARVYAAADAVLFPVTWPEPFGLVPLEAMSVGRPVVATGTGGSGEYLEHEVNCLLFEAGDSAGLAAAVRRLASDPSLRERLVLAGRGTAARFTVAGFTSGLIAALEAAVRR